MTVTWLPVCSWAAVVRNKGLLLLKARPRSAAPLAGRAGMEAGRPACQSASLTLRCVEQHVGLTVVTCQHRRQHAHRTGTGASGGSCGRSQSEKGSDSYSDFIWRILWIKQSCLWVLRRGSFFYSWKFKNKPHRDYIWTGKVQGRKRGNWGLFVCL